VPIRILVVDDHRMFAEALAATLSKIEDMTVVGTASDASSATAMTRSLDPM
jgi:two-component system NarL family response regulator